MMESVVLIALLAFTSRTMAFLLTPRSSTEMTPPDIIGGFGSVMGIAAYAIALVATMGLVPRRDEGIRQVVDVPWPVYVSAPALLAFGVLLVIAFWVPKQKWSSYFIIGFNLAIAVCTSIASGLLRHDFIGKV